MYILYIILFYNLKKILGYYAYIIFIFINNNVNFIYCLAIFSKTCTQPSSCTAPLLLYGQKLMKEGL